MATPRPPARHFLSVLVIVLCASAPAFAEAPVSPDHAEKMARGTELFTKSIRPLLTERCLKCHGGEKTRSGFDLTTRDGLLKGGDKGLVVTPGDSKESRLYRFVAHLEEPFTGETGDAARIGLSPKRAASPFSAFLRCLSEAIWDEGKALDLMTTRALDARIGADFFGDPERMHRDLLGDAARGYLDELFKPR